jgi:hypothetical protein
MFNRDPSASTTSRRKARCSAPPPHTPTRGRNKLAPHPRLPTNLKPSTLDSGLSSSPSPPQHPRPSRSLRRNAVRASCLEIDRAAFDLLGRRAAVYRPTSACYTAHRHICNFLRGLSASDKMLPSWEFRRGVERWPACNTRLYTVQLLPVTYYTAQSCRILVTHSKMNTNVRSACWL